MDIEKLNKHRNYLINSYKRDFISNQGIEHIFDMIHQYSVFGEWLDLGSGSCSIFWKIGSRVSNSILAVDLDPEIEIIIDELFREQFSEGCFKHFMNEYGVSPSELYSTQVRYEADELLDNDLSQYRGYDMVTQFGLLGLCKNEDEFILKTNQILQTIKENGIYLAANWIFSKSYSKSKGFSNNYITIDLLKNFAFKHKLKVLEMKEIIIENDADYDKVIIYAFQKANIEIGIQQSYDCKNVNIKKVDSEDKVRDLIHKINTSLGHSVLKEEYQIFKPYGITGIAIISASHIAIHTWPEYNYVAVDVFSCYSNGVKIRIEQLLKDQLETNSVVVREWVRGAD